VLFVLHYCDVQYQMNQPALLIAKFYFLRECITYKYPKIPKCDSCISKRQAYHQLGAPTLMCSK